MSKLTTSAKARFFSKVSIEDGCWFWTGAKRGPGYGVFTIGGIQYAAHRVMFAIEHPEHEELMFTRRSCVGYRTDYILHSCDNPSCVNPAHLRMGTATDNSRDMVVRRRNPASRRPTAKKGEAR